MFVIRSMSGTVLMADDTSDAATMQANADAAGLKQGDYELVELTPKELQAALDKSRPAPAVNATNELLKYVAAKPDAPQSIKDLAANAVVVVKP